MEHQAIHSPLWVDISIIPGWASRSESKGLTSILLESPVDVHR